MILNLLTYYCPNKYLLIFFIFVSYNINIIWADLPDDLDSFLGVLFGTEECETFLEDASFLSVATKECKPYVCNFPYQLCMRPASKYNDEKSNQCRNLPDKCLLAANKGNPLPQQKSDKRLEHVNGSLAGELTTLFPDKEDIYEHTTPFSLVAPQELLPKFHGFEKNGRNKHFGPICNQGMPDGRFCGFELKFVFNRETKKCDQFWYPGCRTEETNENLFNTKAECKQATEHCGLNRRVVSTKPPIFPSVPDSITNEFGNNGPEQLISIGKNLAARRDSAGNDQNVVNTFSQFLTGSALGSDSNGGNVGQIGGGQPFSTENGRKLFGNTEESSNSQQPNFIRLIANTIREVGASQITPQSSSRSVAGIAKSNPGEWLNRFDASQFTNILQSFG